MTSLTKMSVLAIGAALIGEADAHRQNGYLIGNWNYQYQFPEKIRTIDAGDHCMLQSVEVCQDSAAYIGKVRLNFENCPAIETLNSSSSFNCSTAKLDGPVTSITGYKHNSANMGAEGIVLESLKGTQYRLGNVSKKDPTIEAQDTATITGAIVGLRYPDKDQLSFVELRMVSSMDHKAAL